MNSDQIAQMRRGLGNLGALRELSKTDTELASKAQYISTKANAGSMNSYEQEDLAKFVLDWHTNGKIPQQTTMPGFAQATRNVAQSSKPKDVMGTKEQGFSFLNTVKNIPSSGAQFIGDTAKGLANVFNPDMKKNTIVNLGKMLIGAGGNAVESVAGLMGVENPEELLNLPGEDLASAVGQFYADRYGGVDNILQTIEKDPVGFLADLSTVVTVGGTAVKGIGNITKAAAKGASRISTVEKISKVGGKIAGFGDEAAKIGASFDPAVGMFRVGKAAVKGVQGMGKFGLSQATGLSGDTISTIVSNPKFEMAKSGKITRPGLASKVQSAIEQISDELDETGRGYQPIIKGSKGTTLPEGWMDDFLKQEGFQIAKGKVANGNSAMAKIASKADTGKPTKVPISSIQMDDIDNLQIAMMKEGKKVGKAVPLDPVRGDPNLPIRLGMTDDGFHVIDGHHRLMDAIQRGKKSINATVEGKRTITQGAMGLDAPMQLSNAEMKVLNDFYREFSRGGKLTANQFVNLRRKIGKLSQFDKTVDSKSLEALAQKLYDHLNDTGREAIPGLQQLDESYAPMRRELSLLKKEFVDPKTGELRDSVMNRIANATGKGKDQFLGRIKKLVPEIEEEIRAMKALEDVDFGGTKVGTYTRSILQSGGVAAGVLSGNPLLVLGAIATTPTIAVPILQTYGKVARIPASTINAIVKRIGLGSKLTKAQKAIMSEALRYSTISQPEYGEGE